jgi:phosphatidylglycerophosphate synthase
MSTRSPRPSIAELRAATQPASIFERNSGEHWVGRLYMRRFSPYLTRLLLRTPLTPNGVTGLMILTGLVAAAVLTLPGIVPAIVVVALLQLQILLDCSDGELARWTGRKSPMGIYLDRVGHYVTEAALPVGLGIRADGGWDHIGGWTTIGLAISVVVLLIRTESALVLIARVESGLPPAQDTAAVAAPRVAGLAAIRSAMTKLPFYRAFVAQEASFLALAAAIGDQLAGDLDVTRGLVIALVPIAVVTLLGHGAAIMLSSRLR